MVRKIVEKIPEATLQGDLERYRLEAIELGATDAKIITSDMVIIDERVRAKCIYPKCRSYGTNAHCPPHAMELHDVRQLIERYKYGIFIDIIVPTDVLAGPNINETREYIPSGLQLYKIVSQIEAEAFYDGYHLALGFGVGSCKSYFCPKSECSALQTGQACRHALRARASMESMGMDAFTMAANAGWDIYPIGAAPISYNAPHGHRLGLILIQ